MVGKRPLQLALLLAFVVAAFSPRWAVSQQDSPSTAQGDAAASIPAYHHGPPPRWAKQPPILRPDQLTGYNGAYPFQSHAYELAAKIPNVLYQEPCYCRCDREEGHTSLRSCFSDLHGAQCGTCMKELYYSYIETKKGRGPARIRAGIIRGDWQKIDLRAAANIK